jgi:putative transposase
VFLRHLVDRGLSGVRLIDADACRELVESVAEFLPDAQWQRCVVHFYRNVSSLVPSSKVRDIARMLKAIHAQEDREAATEKMTSIIAEPRDLKLVWVGRTDRGAWPGDPDLLCLSRQPLAEAVDEQSA